MGHIDALSRSPTSLPQDTEMELLDERLEVFVTMTEEEKVISMQRTDTRLKEIMEILGREQTGCSATDNEIVKNYHMQKWILYRKVNVDGEDKQLWVVPNAMHKSIVIRFHDLAGHFAVDRMVNKIKERYDFPRMRRYAQVHIRCCPECVLLKVPRGKQSGELHPIKPGKRPFEVVNVDHIGPFVKSTKGNSYILVLIDNLTKYVQLYPVKIHVSHIKGYHIPEDEEEPDEPTTTHDGLKGSQTTGERPRMERRPPGWQMSYQM
ncbi:hypothetical protein AGLY_002311 [Aphis glycines]|uniref:Integrase zinc-binding domain-containing protein n=1 Tax=Aphis glycines TaxID=307491 RepID=A0A6G0U314_APHGL|nr:hypothetical protein AGLY_002311 [Aphis glycines]